MKLVNSIVPTPENDHAPHLLQKTAFLLLCGLIILSFAITNLQSLLWQSSDWLVGTVLPAVVVEKTNEARSELQAAPLRRNALLDEAARLKAEDMAKNGYFAHYSPSGVSPWHWFDEVGYVYAHAGENLAVHFNDSKAVVSAWLDSPTHRANIENGNYLEIGVGTAEGEYEGFKTVFVVQLFGTPAAPIQPTVSTTPESAVSVATIPDLPGPVAPETAVLGEATKELTSTESVPSEPVAKEEMAPVPVEISPEVVPTALPVAAESFTATSSSFTPIPTELFALGTVVQSGSSAPAGALATTPNTVLRYIYLSIGTLVAIMLLLSVAMAVRYHRPWQIAYGIGLLVLMSGLFYLQSALMSTVALADSVPSEAILHLSE